MILKILLNNIKYNWNFTIFDEVLLFYIILYLSKGLEKLIVGYFIS